MKNLLLACSVLASFNICWAETNNGVFLPGENPPTYDQPWTHQQNSISASDSQAQGGDRSIPPTKGVIHVRRDGEGSEAYGDYLKCLEELRERVPNPRHRDYLCDRKHLQPEEDLNYYEINYTGINVIEADTDERPIFVPGRRGIGFLPVTNANEDVLQRPVIYRSYDLTQSNQNHLVVQIPILQLKQNGLLSQPVIVAEYLVNESSAVDQIASQLGVNSSDVAQVIAATGSALALVEGGTSLLIPELQMFTNIDPENERPIDFGGYGIPGFRWVSLQESIDPEREWPILGGSQGIGVMITIPGIGPGRDREIDLPQMVSAFHPVGTTNVGYPYPVINVPPATMASLKDWSETFPPPGQTDVPQAPAVAMTQDWGETYPPPGQTDVPMFQSLREMARNLSAPELEIHTVHLTTAAVLGSLTILAYRVLGIGGRARALAAVVPPQIILDATGRAGYRVPAHETYSEEEALAMARQIDAMSNDELEDFMNTVDPELIEYMEVIDYYVRQARGREFQQWCPDVNQCS